MHEDSKASIPLGPISIMLLFGFMVGCGSVERPVSEESAWSSDQGKTCNWSDSILDDVPQTLSSTVDNSDVESISGSYTFSDQQIDCWLNPFPSGRRGESVKLMGVIQQSSSVVTLLIGNLLGHYHWPDEPPYYDMEQYAVSIDKQEHRLIGHLLVQGHISGDMLGDSVVPGKGLILFQEVWSDIEGDTIRLTEHFEYLEEGSNEVSSELRHHVFATNETGVFLKIR